MHPLAVGLVLFAAVLHATWNLLNKRAGDGGAEFVFLTASVASLLFAPWVLTVSWWQMASIGTPQLMAMLGSGLLHIGYALSLQRGYAAHDLSIVYPVARGLGPVLATCGAVAIFGERPPLAALIGAGMVAGGVFVLARWSRGNGGRVSLDAVGNGAITGCFIAAYTLWDKESVTTYGISALMLMWSTEVVRAVALAPRMRATSVVKVWRRYWREAVGIAVLSDIAYILVLHSYRYAPVSRVAPMREVSILVGVVLASWHLKEKDLLRRLPAAAAIVGGVVLLAAS